MLGGAWVGGWVDLLLFTIRKQTGVNTEDTKERREKWMRE